MVFLLLELLEPVLVPMQCTKGINTKKDQIHQVVVVAAVVVAVAVIESKLITCF